MLTQEEWDALSAEEQATRLDEKPEGASQKEPQQQSTEELQTQLTELKSELDSLKNEKQGIYRDLKGEREVRQQLEATVAELQNRGKGGDEFDIEQMADDDYLTAGQVKKLIRGLQSKSDQESAADVKKRAAENYAVDEDRMVEASKEVTDDFPVPYKDAIEEFTEMARKRPALWRAVHEESIRANGKPAETAYRIALTSKKFMNKVKANTREQLLKELEDQGQIKPRKLPSGGPGKQDLDPSKLSEKDLLELSDAQLDDLLAKT